MTDIRHSYADHVATLENLISFIRMNIGPYKKFLLDFVSLQADFVSINIPNVDRLPAISWKQQNLKRLQKENPMKFVEQYEKLARLL